MPQVVDYDYAFVPTLEQPVPEEHKYIILIPHLDPGFVSYGAADPVILQYMHLTWCKTVLLIEEVLRALERNDPVAPAPGTREFCQALLVAFEERLQQGELQARFEQVKAAAVDLTRTTMEGTIISPCGIQ
ncbi:hypothetical protein BCR43DRAFT_118528 [Syncephalastrum racemosum]|uniref:Uncharacterized protein n=1 Tax=Syncephalastrum racemosum TaxID=13706 RepID=A0A1X2GZE7_SYNRA|nr:hypothetical protein BCR43DRAFT_118528 [Syncephalastrum racemosum]